MNINQLVTDLDKDVSSHKLLNDRGSASVISIRKGKVLKEHQSVSHAVLILISGDAVYEELDRKEFLNTPMDYVHILPHVSHKVSANSDSLLMLIH